jgi:hypothetical protein
VSTLSATALAGTPVCRHAEIRRIEYTTGGMLAVHVHDIDTHAHWLVRFDEVEAFRVVDELHLLTYWPTCSAPNGWLYRIDQQGWLSEEQQRPGSNLALISGVQEYLVAGICECVSVLSRAAPAVTAAATGG